MADGFPFIDRKADLPFALMEFMNYANQGIRAEVKEQ